MKRQLRVVLAIVLAELFLVGLWVYLERLASARPGQVAPDFHQTLGSTLGSVMGGLLGFGLILFLIARKNDRSRGGR